jgi:FAD/FMN-containing dehydrogenase
MAVSHVLGDATLGELDEALQGVLIRPTDPAYDEARAVWNTAIDRRPAAIARCAGTADIRQALGFAHSQQLAVAVRGSGHSIAGFSTCDGGLVVDLSPMKGILIDPAARRVVAQAGVVWGELDHETQAFGLAVTGGMVSTTGVAGHTLGGGLGWLMRRLALTCDNLLAADVVTADGQLLHADANSNPELFWAVRGGGGNFGVVTALEYRLHAVAPVVLGGPVLYPGAAAVQVLRGWRDAVADLSEDVTTVAILGTAPTEPLIPEALHGRLIVAVVAVHAGPLSQGNDLVRPLRELAAPAADLLTRRPYLAMQGLLDAWWGRAGRIAMRSVFLRRLSDRAIDALVALHAHGTAPNVEVRLHHLGGAVARVATGETAFGQRQAPFLLHAVARSFGPDDDAQLASAAAAYEAVAPDSTGAAYPNLTDEAGEAEVRAFYPGPTYQRLVAVKDRYDPDNVFLLNHNIRPSPEAGAVRQDAPMPSGARGEQP